MPERKNEAVWQEKYSRWQIKVQTDNERRSFYSSKPGKKGKIEAERKADEWLDSNGQKDNIRFGELCRLYLASIDTGNGTGHYRREKSTISTWLLPVWEHKRVSSLTNRDYQQAINAPAEATPPRSKRTCGHVRSTITALWSYAQSDRIFMEAPMKLKIPKAATVKERHILQSSDILKLMNHGEEYFYIHAFRFLLITGLRRGELCGLKKEDLQGNILTIRRSVNFLNEETSGKTASAQRSFILPETALNVLCQQQSMLEAKGIESEWLFPNSKGAATNSNSLYNRWLFVRNKLDLPPVSIHELRHTMISTLKTDLPLPLLKPVVGHVPAMNTLEIYGHETAEDAARAARIIDEIYNKILRE